jgi:hypothetical protein
METTMVRHVAMTTRPSRSNASVMMDMQVTVVNDVPMAIMEIRMITMGDVDDANATAILT